MQISIYQFSYRKKKMNNDDYYCYYYLKDEQLQIVFSLRVSTVSILFYLFLYLDGMRFLFSLIVCVCVFMAEEKLSLYKHVFK